MSTATTSCELTLLKQAAYKEQLSTLEVLDELGMGSARPGPAAELREAALVHRHDNDVPGGLPAGALDLPVVDDLVQVPEQLPPGEYRDSGIGSRNLGATGSGRSAAKRAAPPTSGWG